MSDLLLVVVGLSQLALGLFVGYIHGFRRGCADRCAREAPVGVRPRRMG